MSLRSYSLFKGELKSLREFYRVTLFTYQKLSEVYKARSSSEFRHQLKMHGVSWRDGKKNIGKAGVRNKTEAMLRELIVVRAISALETYLTDIVRDVFVVTKSPFLDKSVRINLSQEELIANNSPAKIYNKIINKETRKLASGGFNEFIKYYKKRFDIDLSKIPPGYKAMNEYHDRRNILVHRLGQTDELYRKKYSTDKAKLIIEVEYVDKLLADLWVFSLSLEKQVADMIESISIKTPLYNSRYIVDICFLKGDVPECLQPNFQYWADDEYVVMNDLIIGTSPAEKDGVRYYFDGSDRALNSLKRYLRREVRRLNIISSVVVDLVNPAKRLRYISQEHLNLIKNELPCQPWPKGVHKVIAKKLNLSNSLVSFAIKVLISKGFFKNQIDGIVVDSG